MRAYLVFVLHRDDNSEKYETVKVALSEEQLTTLELLYSKLDAHTILEGPGLLVDYDNCDKEVEWKPMQKCSKISSL